MSLTRTDHSPVVYETLVAISEQAVHSAELVRRYLESLGLRSTPKSPIPFPRWFLLDLGTALQIACWELSGVAAFIPETLPSSIELIREIFEAVEDPNTFVSRGPNKELGIRVMLVHLRYFAFRPYPTRAPVVVGRPNEDNLLDALALYLWQTRKAESNTSALSPSE